MNYLKMVRNLGVAGAVVLGAAACDSGEALSADHHEAHARMNGEQGADEQGGMMARHGQEADSALAVLRTHVAEMRRVGADGWHDRMGEHVPHVSGMLAMMDRHMREMGMHGGGHGGHGGHNAGHGEHGGHMMGEEHHDQMMASMKTLRAEVERLQTGSASEVRAQMPAHLDRIEGMFPMMQMCSNHAMGQGHDEAGGHDHAGHDHAGHDHAGHDHAGHDHAGH
jgi:hypothetical protein